MVVVEYLKILLNFAFMKICYHVLLNDIYEHENMYITKFLIYDMKNKSLIAL